MDGWVDARYIPGSYREIETFQVMMGGWMGGWMLDTLQVANCTNQTTSVNQHQRVLLLSGYIVRYQNTTTKTWGVIRWHSRQINLTQ